MRRELTAPDRSYDAALLVRTAYPLVDRTDRVNARRVVRRPSRRCSTTPTPATELLTAQHQRPPIPTRWTRNINARHSDAVDVQRCERGLGTAMARISMITFVVGALGGGGIGE